MNKISIYTNRVYFFRCTTFNGNVEITRYGSSDTCKGGNIFNTSTIIRDSSSSSNFLMANTTADDYNGNVTFIQKGSSVNLYPAYTKNWIGENLPDSGQPAV